MPSTQPTPLNASAIQELIYLNQRLQLNKNSVKTTFETIEDAHRDILRGLSRTQSDFNSIQVALSRSSAQEPLNYMQLSSAIQSCLDNLSTTKETIQLNLRAVNTLISQTQSTSTEAINRAQSGTLSIVNRLSAQRLRPSSPSSTIPPRTDPDVWLAMFELMQFRTFTAEERAEYTEKIKATVQDGTLPDETNQELLLLCTMIKSIIDNSYN